MSMSTFAVVLALGVAVTEASHAMTVRVDAGELVYSNGTREWVGTTTSELQANVVDALFPTITSADIAEISFFNSTELRYLDLSGGQYVADGPLSLPSMFVLRLNHYDNETGFVLQADAATSDKYPSIVKLDTVSFSAVVGGYFDATANSSWQGIHVENGGHNSVRDLTVNGTTAVDSLVQVRGGSKHEVAHLSLNGMEAAKRGIWLIATSTALVHDNYIADCARHVLDLDAYCSGSAAWNNVIVNAGSEGLGEAIFVEETASGNFVFGNTIRGSKNVGIGVYSNEVGPVSSNIIASNLIEDSANKGITSGGVGDDATKHADSNVFVANVARDNAAGDFQVLHGYVEGDYWVSNDGDTDGEWIGKDPQSYANVSVFAP